MMINLRKMKYIIITDGVKDKEDINVVACDSIYEAQNVFKQGLEKGLEPALFEMDEFIKNWVVQDRFVNHGEPTEEHAEEMRQGRIKLNNILNKIKESL